MTADQAPTVGYVLARDSGRRHDLDDVLAEASARLDPGCGNCDGIGCMGCRTRTVHDECVHDCPSCRPGQTPDRDVAIREAWHDVVCPEGPDCRDRGLHAASEPLVTSGIVHRFLDRLAALSPASPCEHRHYEPYRADGRVVLSAQDERLAIACCPGVAGDLAEGVNRLDDLTGELNDVTYWLQRFGVEARRANGAWDLPGALRELAARPPDGDPPAPISAGEPDGDDASPGAAVVNEGEQRDGHDRHGGLRGVDSVEVRELLDVWGADRRVAHMLRDQVRAAWPAVGQRLDDLLETRDATADGDPAHRYEDWPENLPRADLIRFVRGYGRELREVEQLLAGALGYPRGCGDVWPADEHVTGDHTPVTIAMEAARKINASTASGDTATPARPWEERRAGLMWDEIDDLIAEHAFVGTDESGPSYPFVHSSDAADKLWALLAPFSSSPPATPTTPPAAAGPAADPAPTYRREEPRRVGQAADPATDLADVERLIAEAPADYPGLPLLHRRRDELAAALPAPSAADRWTVPADGPAPPDVAGLLLACAAARREYAQGAPETTADLLLHEAMVWEQAAQITRGDYSPLWGALPSWRWTPGMDRAVRAGAPRGALPWADVAGVVERSADVVPDPDPAPADPDA